VSPPSLLTTLLRPRPDRRFPRQLKPRKVHRLVAELADGLRDPGFAALLSRIDDGGAVRAGNHLELFIEGEAASLAMLAAIAAAQSEVLLESYIFVDDDTGRRFACALREAAGRGVRVCVLADAIGSFSTRDVFWKELREAGVEVRLFHRLFPDLWWQPFRDHRKILLVDREVAFTGGMNIADEYSAFSLRKKRLPPGAMRDTHVRLVGPSVWDLVPVFAEAWERARGTPLPPWPPCPVASGGAQVLVLDSRPGRGHLETAAALAAIVAAARESVWLTNAYFAPGHTAVAILGLAAQRRGIDVRLLLPGKTDVPLVRHAGHGWYSRLLAKGVRIFEYQRTILHAKALVVDGYASVVGSSNLDFRSFQLNAECNLVVLDEEVGQGLRRAFELDLRDSQEVTLPRWRQRGTLHRLLDRGAGMLTPVL
jgi:cardiolipin synthase